MAKALMWYIGASTRTVCGRATGRHCSIIGVLKSSLYTAGSDAHDHLRRAGRAAAADALHRAATDVGQVGDVGVGGRRGSTAGRRRRQQELGRR